MRVFFDGQDRTTRVLLLRIPAGTSITESIPLSSIYIISRTRSPPQQLARAVTTGKLDRGLAQEIKAIALAALRSILFSRSDARCPKTPPRFGKVGKVLRSLIEERRTHSDTLTVSSDIRSGPSDRGAIEEPRFPSSRADYLPHEGSVNQTTTRNTP